MRIDALVEGIMDEAVAQRMVSAAGHDFGTSYGKRGCGYIKVKAPLFNASAPRVPLLVLVDFMDTHAECLPEAVSTWLPHRHRNVLFRIVVREIECWLMADRNNFSRFIGISSSRLSTTPESLADPKLAVVNLARKSRLREVRDSLVPARNSTAQVGTLYTTEMIRFIREHWDIQAARQISPSLDSCMRRLEQLH